MFETKLIEKDTNQGKQWAVEFEKNGRQYRTLFTFYRGEVKSWKALIEETGWAISGSPTPIDGKPDPDIFYRIGHLQKDVTFFLHLPYYNGAGVPVAVIISGSDAHRLVIGLETHKIVELSDKNYLITPIKAPIQNLVYQEGESPI